MRVGDFITYAPKSVYKAGDADPAGAYMFFTSSSDEDKRIGSYQFDCEGIIMGTGGNATLHYYKGKFSVSTDCVVIITDERVKCKYLYYFFLANMHILEEGFKGAGLKHTNKNYINSIEISEIPTISEQEKIILILDTVYRVLCERREQLSTLEVLIKARFIEMFGDPNSNPKGWIVDALGQYMTFLTDFSANGSYELLDSNIVMRDEPDYAIMVRTTDLESGNLKTGVKYIDQHAYELLSKSKLYGGELIMNKIGSAGKIYVMPKINRPASLGRNAFMFRFNDRINITYLYAMLTTEYGEKEIQQHVRGAVTKTITKDATRSIRIIVPPIELQNQFASFVTQVDKSKVAVQAALNKTQLLFDGLMQKYFE